MTNNQNIDEKVILVPFDTNWNKLFEIEVFQLQKKLGQKIITIEHIGSTAIPNIYSKPIIDIMIGIKNLEKSESVINDLIELEYEYLGNAGVIGRLYFRKRAQNNYNVALCDFEGEVWNNNILFRDYLISHPDVAETYSKIKINALKLGKNSLLKYSDTKKPFINKILKLIKFNSEK